MKAFSYKKVKKAGADTGLRQKFEIYYMKRTIPIIYIAILLAGCKKEATNYWVRMTVLNSVPDAAAIDIYAASEKLDAATRFGQPDFYLPLPAVTDSIKWKISGSSSYDSAFLADLPNGYDYTLLFYDSASRYKPYLIKDDWQQPSSETKGYIRFFPMIVGATSIAITNDTGKVLLSGRSFGDFKSKTGSFTAIDSFQTKLRLYNNNVLLDSIVGATILPGKSYTIYGVGVLNASGDKRPRFFIQEHQ